MKVVFGFLIAECCDFSKTLHRHPQKSFITEQRHRFNSLQIIAKVGAR